MARRRRRRSRAGKVDHRKIVRVPRQGRRKLCFDKKNKIVSNKAA